VFSTNHKIKFNGGITLIDIFGNILNIRKKKTGVAANRAIKPIAVAWEKQKQFVADASHELKTPLSIINANYDALLANQDETIKSQSKWLGNFRIGTDRMANILKNAAIHIVFKGAGTC
jgi:signal transduction histidine kinase